MGETKREETAGDAVVGCATVLLLPVFVVWEAYVATVLWGWFVVTTFGAPPLSFQVAIGIGLTARTLVGRRPHQSVKDRHMRDVVVEAFAHGLLAPALALAVGWLVK